MRVLLVFLSMMVFAAPAAFADARSEAALVEEKLRQALAGQGYDVVRTCDTNSICTITLTRAD